MSKKSTQTPSVFKKHGILIVSVIAAAIIVATYIANGSERDTAWLYIASVGMVLMVPLESLFRKK